MDMRTRQQWEPKNPAEVFFPVELRPLYMPSNNAMGHHSRLGRHLAVVDVERDEAFTVVTKDYALVTNRQAYEMADEVMRKVFQATGADDMDCLNVTMPKTRSFCHIDLIRKSSGFSPFENDKWTAFLRISNSYNRTKLLRFELGFCRWICTNGMIFGQKSVEFRYAHTRQSMGRVKSFHDNIGDIRKIEAELSGKLCQLREFAVPEDAMLPIACRAFGISFKREDLGKGRRVESVMAMRDRIRELTGSYFSEMGGNGYAALNVLTDYATRPAGVIAPEASMHGLQQKATDWMEDFLSAIRNPGFAFEKYMAEWRDSAELIGSL